MTLHATLDALLAEHGLTAAREQEFEHTGFSGATLTRLIRADGERFVLKRTSLARDWIMRATDDTSCREVHLMDVNVTSGSAILTPAVGSANDGRGYALLMRDITTDLIAPGMTELGDLTKIIAHIADLHRIPAPTASLPWCNLSARLSLLTPASAVIATDYGAPVADEILRGWQRFGVLAPPAMRTLLNRLFADPTPVLQALNRLTPALLHGDLKFDNIGLTSDGRMWLIDWALALIAPPAVELGWFLAINSRRLPLALDDVMSLYADAAAIPDAVRAQHDALTVLCGLLLRGWRKALDADAGEPGELQWWCERASAAVDQL